MIQFWGVEEVGNWLESLGLSEYKELFAKHDIRGPELLALDRPDLKVSLAILAVHWAVVYILLFLSSTRGGVPYTEMGMSNQFFFTPFSCSAHLCVFPCH